MFPGDASSSSGTFTKAVAAGASVLKTAALTKVETKANVAFDMFLDASATKADSTSGSAYEVMVWFGRIGEMQPIGYSQGAISTYTFANQVLSVTVVPFPILESKPHIPTFPRK